MIRITCQCCFGVEEFKGFDQVNMHIATGLYVESDHGVICASCYAEICATEVFQETREKIKEIKAEGYGAAIEQIQSEYGYSPSKPPELAVIK